MNNKIIYAYSLAVLLACAVTPPARASDPTQPEMMALTPVTTAAQATAVPKLTLIQSSGSRFQAVINGQLVRPGDTIDGYQVSRINARQVFLHQGERQLVLNLFNTTTK